MKQRSALALLFIVGCATGGVAAQLVVPPVRAGTSPTRWEYQCASVGTVWLDADEMAAATKATLNKLGAAGWELASVAPAKWQGSQLGYSTGAYMLCAKRALP